MWYRTENGVIVGGPTSCAQEDSSWVFYEESDPAVAAFVSSQQAANSESFVKAQILGVSQQALASGALHEMLLLMMQSYLSFVNKRATEQGMTDGNGNQLVITDEMICDVTSPYYYEPYVHNKQYYMQLLSLQGQK